MSSYPDSPDLLIAHGPTHGLLEHLQSVAEGAAVRAPPSARQWAYLAGLWHDLGKCRPGFQRYVRQDRDAHIEGRSAISADKTHSAAGALHALMALQQQHADQGRRAGWLLAHLIAAHHAGLYDTAALADRLQGGGAKDSERERHEALTACAIHHPKLLVLPDALNPGQALTGIPGIMEKEPLAQSLWLRMMFSALVDADFLDTERYFNQAQATRRGAFPPLSDYLARLNVYLENLTVQVGRAGRGADPVMNARAQVLADCRNAALKHPGVFSLQVPTGGGKTLASVAFALGHALEHGFERVIVAIPYTSIVEQTADIFGKVFGIQNIIEHHSQADGEHKDETAASRLACENWDAPLIVTTNVQLFESLFAARTSRCRKLHSLQNSVIILDEAQTLPPPFLQPTLDALRLLVNHYNVTLVSCTATQPVLSDIQRFDPRASLRGLTSVGTRPHEIIRSVEPLYAALERVRLQWPQSLQAPEDIAPLAARISAYPTALAIVNTRSDAAQLVRALNIDAHPEAKTLHLSAAMCGQHRADVIREIRSRLESSRTGKNPSLRVVSTQLIEAGVDVDFPVVFRALAGLDSIAQAAGRCNREGRLGSNGGQVHVFVREIPSLLASLKRAAQSTVAVLGDSRPESLPPSLFSRYFEHWYSQFNLDEKGVLPLLKNSPDFNLNLRSAAERYRLIDDQDQAIVVVPYVPSDGLNKSQVFALAALKAGTAERWQLRVLQRLVVQVRRREVLGWQARSDVVETMPGWFVLKDEQRYHPVFGLLPEGTVLDAATLVQ